MKNLPVFCLFLAFMIPLGFAAAQDIPLPLLESDRKNCKASCINTYSGQQCTQLCDCTVTAFKRQVNFDLYLQMIAEISQNSLSKDNARLMDAIAAECSANIFGTMSPLSAASAETELKP